MHPTAHDLREDVVGMSELLAQVGEALGVLVATLLEDHSREERGRRREDSFSPNFS